jgi:hypothetical protein
VNVSWWRNDPKLLKYTEQIYQDPVFYDLPASGVSEDDPLHLDRSACGRVAQERSCLRAAHRPVRGKLVTLSDLVLDGTVEIGEGSAEGSDQLLEPHPAARHTPTQRVANAVGRDQFIHNGQVAFIESLVVTTQATCSRVAGMNGLPDKAS